MTSLRIRRSPTPVSYTHLVHAQIELIKAEQERFNFNMTPITKEQCILDNKNESIAIYWMTTDIMWADGEGMAQLLYLLGVEPVSYTHLDVYKRQPRKSITRALVDPGVRD